jgi:hypothetical protein
MAADEGSDAGVLGDGGAAEEVVGDAAAADDGVANAAGSFGAGALGEGAREILGSEAHGG